MHEQLSWLDSALSVLGRMGYLGAFLAGLLGSSVPFFPSYVLIPLMATQFNPFIVGVVSGVGAGVGQYLHYYIGFGGRYLFSAEARARFERWRTRFDKYGAWLVLVIAATPLTPDDVIWIPLGLVGYPKTKALIAGILGKTILNLVYAYAGYYGWPLIGQSTDQPDA
jgi:membrane protein YqaA with SNARE-associated domain